jgi:ABC-2 type transport system ATP-binding protein
MSLGLERVNKSFGQVHAVNDLSIEVKEGAIFGFLGQNGAGKSTTMRMILDIIRPDTGTITWKGQPVSQVARRDWGYLPEERGLYPKMVVDEQLLFLAQLQGMPKSEVQRELDIWIERFQLAEYRKRKVDELSKGNQQKVQFLASVLHNPTILIMDEPFTGLDPVNVNLLKEAFLEMHHLGKTIIFSTHQMETVEELCQDIAIIKRGQLVRYGNLRQIKRATGRTVVRLALENDPTVAWLDNITGVEVTKRRQDYVEMNLTAPATPQAILTTALQHNAQVLRFEIAEPSLNDIFIEAVGGLEATTLADQVATAEQLAQAHA